MASKQNKRPEGSVVGRLAERGEEAVGRLMEELTHNPRVSDALARLDTASRGALNTIGLAAANELKELRKEIEQLEKRLEKLERSSPRSSTKRSETKKRPTAKRRATRAKTEAEKERAPSPSPGRAIGGGPGRSATPG